MNLISEAPARPSLHELVRGKKAMNTDYIYLKYLFDWERNELSDRKRTLRVPHWIGYSSALTPVFLERMESLQLLDRLSPVLIRDGLLSLAYFFHRNPNPEALSSATVLFVNRRFAPFVPPAWASRIAYYALGRSCGAPSPARAVNDLFLVATILGERQCSLGHLRERLARARDFFAAGERETMVHVVPLVPRKEVREDLFFQYVMEIREAFGPAVQCLRWTDAREREVDGAYFVDLNEFDFFYTDSFVNHHFLSRGALPLSAGESPRSDDLWVDASLCHGYALSWQGKECRYGSAVDLRRELEEFTASDLYQEEQRDFDDHVEPFHMNRKACPPSFESMVYSLARKYGI